jgi:hypothetical protein
MVEALTMRGLEVDTFFIGDVAQAPGCRLLMSWLIPTIECAAVISDWADIVYEGLNSAMQPQGVR